MVRSLRLLTRAVCTHRPWFVWPQVVLFGLCVWFTVAKLEFHTNRNDLVGADKKYHQNFLRFKKEFPAQDDLVVVVESESIARNRQFVERLGAKLELETNLFVDVFYKGDLKMMGPKALLFVPEADLKELHQALNDYRPFIQQFSQASNLASLFGLVNTQFRTAKQETNAANDSLIKALPALRRLIEEGTDILKRPGTPPSPGVNALFGAGAEAEKASYITFANGKIYLVTARARREEVNADAVARIRELIASTQVEVPGVNVGLTGEPVLEVDEMDQSQRDSTIASIVSLVGCALIFIYGYKSTGRPLKAVFALIIGLGYTMGFTTLTVGHLNILTITFVPILIGLAIDFGVHLITRYEEELRNGRSELESMELAMVNTGQGIFTGALTTATAFLAMGLTDFRGIQEMGIICGGGLLVCLVPMMTLLPVLLLRGKQNVIDHASHPVDRRDKLERLWLDRPWTVTGVTLALSGIAVLGGLRVKFDYNLLNMQSAGLPAVEFEEKLIRSSDKSVLFGAVVANSLAEAKQLEARLTALPGVSSIDSMAKFIGDDQTSKLRTVTRIKAETGSIRFAPVDRELIHAEDLSRTMWSLQGYLGLALGSVGDSDKSLSLELASLRKAIADFRKGLLDETNPERLTRATEFQTALFDDLHATFRSLREQDDSAPLGVDDLPHSLRSRFVGVTGKHLLMVYPRTNVWDRAPQAEFVRQLRSIDENATGTPVQLYEYTSLLRSSYEKAAWYAIAAISLMVFFHFKSPTCVILSLIPVGVGFFWMVGFMGWRGIDFNPANIMTLPLVVGIGVTNGIHILNRFAEERDPGILGKSTGKAVLVSGLTTIAGFGSLVIAQHRGISSLGFTMAVGVTTCMVVGLTFLPALLKLLGKAGWKMKNPAPN